MDFETVHRYCDLAYQGDVEALKMLANFISSHQGSMPAQRNALAYLGGTGGGMLINNRKISNLVFRDIVVCHCLL
jgi:hypothetical protein